MSTPAPQLDLHQRLVDDAMRPESPLERWFAGEMAYASWELDRVRAHSANTAAEPVLTAAYSRAGRNWHRARKEILALQTARTNHLTRLPETERSLAASFPLADPARVSGAATRAALDAGQLVLQAHRDITEAFLEAA